jgi:dihydroxy-acid dehydratase
MCCLAEALGMTLPGSALVPAVHSERLRLACQTGEEVCRMVKDGLTARKIINEASIENAVLATLAMSGSTNAVMHLTAIAAEAEAGVDVMELFSRLGPVTPQIVRINPASKWNTEDFWMAGGIPKMLKRMLPIIKGEALTCTGRTVEENVSNYAFPFPDNDEVMKTLDEPFSPRGGIAVLKGNLAPDTGVTKPGAIDPALHVFTGSAKVFDSEDEANEAILAGEIKAGDVVVIRYEGPKGGPGMREMYRAMKYLYGMGLNKSTALVTDGRFSGTNNGCFVGHISPEAAEGGPLAIVRDGDKITIDVIEGRLHLHLTDGEIEERFKTWEKPAPKITKGHLALYSRLASSAAKGAVVRT